MTDPENEKRYIPDTPGDAAREIRKLMKWGEPPEDFIFLSMEAKIALTLGALWLEEFDYLSKRNAFKDPKDSEPKT